MSSFPFHITYKGQALLPTFNKLKRQCYFYQIANKKKYIKMIHHHLLIINLEAHSPEEKEQFGNDLKKILDTLCYQGTRYISILAYKKQQGLVQILKGVKCDYTSYKMSEVNKVIAEVAEEGCHGYIGSALELGLEIAESLKEHCQGQHITLITDGLWANDNDEMQQKCIQLGKRCEENRISLNAIGIGAYYDHGFLQRLIAYGKCNEVQYADGIENYEKDILTLIKKVESLSKTKFTIKNDAVYLCEAHQYFTEGYIEGLSEKQDNILVTYDKPLEFMGLKAKIKKEENIDEVMEYYLYQWGAYLVKQGKIEDAEEIIAETKDIAAYKKVYSAYSMREKGQLYKFLLQLAENPAKRYKEGREEINPQILKKEEPLCLLEVLALIMNDEDSTLFWDYGYTYERIGPTYMPEEQDYVFIKPHLGYGRIERVHIGSKKLNIGVQVKVDGQVEEYKTHLKLDASVYREYNILVNGNLNTKYLIAKLSPAVRKKLRKQGAIQLIMKQRKEVFYKLKLEKLKVVNHRILEGITPEQVVNMLYEKEVLKLKESLINKYLKTYLKEIKRGRNRYWKLYERFKINEKGIFQATDKSVDKDDGITTYKAEVVEWKLEKFPRKRLEEEMIEEYHLDVLKPTSRQIKQLEDVQVILKKQKRNMEDALQFIRIGSILLNKPIFLWENTMIKPKKQTIPFVEGNAVVGDCMHVSTLRIGERGIREERYTLIVGH